MCEQLIYHLICAFSLLTLIRSLRFMLQQLSAGPSFPLDLVFPLEMCSQSVARFHKGVADLTNAPVPDNSTMHKVYLTKGSDVHAKSV